MGDSIVRQVDRVVCRKGPKTTIRVCFPGAKVRDLTPRVGSVVGSGVGGSVIVHVGTNNVDRQGSEAVLGEYQQLIKELKQRRVGQIVFSGILPVRGEFRNSRRLSINNRLQRMCAAEEVGYVDFWDCFYGREEYYANDGLHLNRRGSDVLAGNFLRALSDGIGNRLN